MAKVVAKLGRVVSKLPEMAKQAQPGLKTFAKYAKVELTPPTLAEMPKVGEGFQNIVEGAKTGKWKTLTVKEAWLNTLVTAEIVCWFFLGEIIGRGSLIGYNIPGAFHA